MAKLQSTYVNQLPQLLYVYKLFEALLKPRLVTELEIATKAVSKLCRLVLVIIGQPEVDISLFWGVDAL